LESSSLTGSVASFVLDKVIKDLSGSTFLELNFYSTKGAIEPLFGKQFD
jgi:hypothetical protein